MLGTALSGTAQAALSRRPAHPGELAAEYSSSGKLSSSPASARCLSICPLPPPRSACTVQAVIEQVANVSRTHWAARPRRVKAAVHPGGEPRFDVRTGCRDVTSNSCWRALGPRCDPRLRAWLAHAERWPRMQARLLETAFDSVPVGAAQRPVCALPALHARARAQSPPEIRFRRPRWNEPREVLS